MIPLSSHRMTVKKELVNQTSYELQPHMPLCLLYIVFPFLLLLFHGVSSYPVSTFPIGAMVNIIFDRRRSFTKISVRAHFLLACMAKLRARVRFILS